MRQGIPEVMTANKDAVQAVDPSSRGDVMLTAIAMREWLASVIMMFPQNSITHPRQFLFVAVAVADWLVGRAVLSATEETTEEAWTARLLAGS